MKKSIFYVLLLYLALGCTSKTENQSPDNYLIEKNPNVLSLQNKNGLNIVKLTTAIDSIYRINIFKLDSIKLDTIKYFYGYIPQIEIEPEFEDSSTPENSEPIPREKYLLHPLYAFSPQNADYLFKYGTFSILQFKNDSLAKSAFNKIYEIFINVSNEVVFTPDSIRLFYEIFSKGGCAYFYKDKFIIHKYRRCNDNFRVHEKYENSLIEYLYPKGQQKDSGYFMRYCCSCPEQKNIDYR